MSDITNLRERLAVAKKAVETLTMGINVYIDELRSLADKYEDKTKLKSARIVEVAMRIHEQKTKLVELNDQILSIKSDLGD